MRKLDYQTIQKMMVIIKEDGGWHFGYLVNKKANLLFPSNANKLFRILTNEGIINPEPIKKGSGDYFYQLTEKGKTTDCTKVMI
jgi:hypothetical protein